MLVPCAFWGIWGRERGLQNSWEGMWAASPSAPDELGSGERCKLSIEVLAKTYPCCLFFGGDAAEYVLEV